MGKYTATVSSIYISRLKPKLALIKNNDLENELSSISVIMTMDLDRVRILVLGDSGVGKTSLVHLISRGKPLSHITYTIGASIEVKLHEYREGTPSQRPYWIGNYSHLSCRKFDHNFTQSIKCISIIFSNVIFVP